ncbi:MAG: hypothetical protein AAGA12_02680 [Pseudomonadota bacterium]
MLKSIRAAAGGASCLVLLTAPLQTVAQTTSEPNAPALAPAEEPMSLSRLGKIISAVDPEAVFAGTVMRLMVGPVPVMVVTDPAADRMRAMVPIRSTEDMSQDELMRVLQANFDTALDSRYAVADNTLWAVFIHPLAALQKNQFLSALGQTVNLAMTYGSLFTGGALSFGSGDSIPLQRQVIDDLLKKGEDI